VLADPIRPRYRQLRSVQFPTPCRTTQNETSNPGTENCRARLAPIYNYTINGRPRDRAHGRSSERRQWIAGRRSWWPSSAPARAGSPRASTSWRGASARWSSRRAPPWAACGRARSPPPGCSRPPRGTASPTSRGRRAPTRSRATNRSWSTSPPTRAASASTGASGSGARWWPRSTSWPGRTTRSCGQATARRSAATERAGGASP
jgi:hypothetical protein